MNRHDDFEQKLETWLAGQAPPYAPDRVLDAALQRVAAQSQKRGWLQLLIGEQQMTILTRTLAAAAVVAIAALIGYQVSNLNNNVGNSPSPSPSPSAPASTSPSASPSSAEPSAEPSAAALVVRLLAGGEAGRVHVVTVLDDGRVITTDRGISEGASEPPVERRLTAEGVQLIRDEMDLTGLNLADSASYMPVAGPGSEAPPTGGAGPALEVGQPGGGTAVIDWVLFNDIDDLYDLEPQPEAEALEALAGRLSTMEEWLPASGWADQAGVPYAPERYRVYVYSHPLDGDELPVEHTTVSWPLVGGTDVFGDVVASVVQETGDGFSPSRCREMSAGEAAPIVAALETAGARPSEGGIFPGEIFQLGNGATSRIVDVTFEPIMPFADTTCGVEETF